MRLQWYAFSADHPEMSHKLIFLPSSRYQLRIRCNLSGLCQCSQDRRNTSATSVKGIHTLFPQLYTPLTAFDYLALHIAEELCRWLRIYLALLIIESYDTRETDTRDRLSESLMT